MVEGTIGGSANATGGSHRRMDAAAQRAALGRENEAVVLAILAAAGDHGHEPGEARRAAGLAARTFTDTVRRLESRGLVRRDGKRRVFATQAGAIEAGAGVPGVELAPALDAAIGLFPTEAHRAFVRLLLSGIVVRHHLHQQHDSGWPGFIAVGGTGAGKTAAATFAALAFGLDAGRAVRMLRRETPGSVFARRRQERGGAWRVERSSLMDLPFVALDEWDKAAEQVRQEAGSLLLGSTRPDLEGERVEVRPLVMVMLNVQPGRLNDVLHEAFVRRSVVLHTTPLAGQLRDLDEAMHRLFSGATIPRLRLDRLKPPVPALPDDVRSLMRRELLDALTLDGWRLSDVEGLSRLALGRAALLGEGGDLRRAALATALDYLFTAATVGLVRPGFDDRLAAQLGRGVLLPDVRAAQAEAEERRQTEHRDREAEVAAGLAFEHERERRAAELVQARTAMGRPGDPDGKALARALARSAAAIRGCRGQAALDATWHAAGPYLDAARRWVVQRAQQRQAEQDQRARTRTNERWMRERHRHERQQRRAKLAEWTAWRRRLAAMMPCDDANGLLAALGTAKVLTWVETPAPAGAGAWATLKHVVMVGAGHWTHQGATVGPADARRIWSVLCVTAEQQVQAMGGRPAKLPVYRERPRTVAPARPALRSAR